MYIVAYRTFPDGRYHRVGEYEERRHAESMMRCTLMAGFHCAAVLDDSGDVLIERSHLPVFPVFGDNEVIDWSKEGF